MSSNYKFEIKKHSNRPSIEYESSYAIHTNFEFTQALSDSIYYTEGITTGNIHNRYFCEFSVATRFFNEKTIVNRIRKLMNNFVKELEKKEEPIKEVVKNVQEKISRLKFITK